MAFDLYHLFSLLELLLYYCRFIYYILPVSYTHLTLNLLLPNEMATPPDGVYANRVCIDGIWYDGVGNVGDNPTFKNPVSYTHLVLMMRVITTIAITITVIATTATTIIATTIIAILITTIAVTRKIKKVATIALNPCYLHLCKRKRIA